MDLTNIPNSLVEKVICEYVKGDRNRAVMIDRYINLMCYEKLAEKHDVSVSTVKRIIGKYSNIMFYHIDKEQAKTQRLVDYTSILPAELVGILAAVMEDLADSIEERTTEASPVVSTEFYNVDGTRVVAPTRGITIVRQRHADGTVRTKKIMKN